MQVLQYPNCHLQ